MSDFYKRISEAGKEPTFYEVTPIESWMEPVRVPAVATPDGSHVIMPIKGSGLKRWGVITEKGTNPTAAIILNQDDTILAIVKGREQVEGWFKRTASLVVDTIQYPDKSVEKFGENERKKPYKLRFGDDLAEDAKVLVPKVQEKVKRHEEEIRKRPLPEVKPPKDMTTAIAALPTQLPPLAQVVLTGTDAGAAALPGNVSEAFKGR